MAFVIACGAVVKFALQCRKSVNVEFAKLVRVCTSSFSFSFFLWLLPFFLFFLSRGPVCPISELHKGVAVADNYRIFGTRYNPKFPPSSVLFRRRRRWRRWRLLAARCCTGFLNSGQFLRLLRYLQVSDELIRVAILWHELWHEGLEEASRLYFSEGNVKGMLTALEPLHQMMEKGPQTLKETSFNQVRMMNSELNFYSAFTI